MTGSDFDFLKMLERVACCPVDIRYSTGLIGTFTKVSVIFHTGHGAFVWHLRDNASLMDIVRTVHEFRSFQI